MITTVDGTKRIEWIGRRLYKCIRGPESLELFDNFVEYERLYGDKGCTAEEPCAPEIVLSGGRDRLGSRVRSLLSPWFDLRSDFRSRTRPARATG